MYHCQPLSLISTQDMYSIHYEHHIQQEILFPHAFISANGKMFYKIIPLLWSKNFDIVLYSTLSFSIPFYFLKIFIYLFIFRERWRDGEWEGEKHGCVRDTVAFHTLPIGGLDCSSGMCPDWELNLWPFGSRPALNPLSHTSKDSILFLNILIQFT